MPALLHFLSLVRHRLPATISASWFPQPSQNDPLNNLNVMQNDLHGGFPDIEYQDDFPDTQPMALYDLPLDYRIDGEIARIGKYHERIAKAIKTFWGHRDCVEYIQKLVLSGGDGAGHSRMGFKNEVMSSLISLIALHEQQYPQFKHK